MRGKGDKAGGLIIIVDIDQVWEDYCACYSYWSHMLYISHAQFLNSLCIPSPRPYFEERYRCNQKLQQLRLQMQTLENKVASSKKAYSAALKKLEVLNTEIHRRRQSTMSQHRLHLEHRKSFSTGSSPEPMRTKLSMRTASSGVSMEGGAASDTESVNSLYLGDLKDQFSGSTGSLPSIGESSVSEVSPCPTPEPIADEDNPIVIRCDKNGETHMNNGLRGGNLASGEKMNSEQKTSMVESKTPTAAEDCETNSDPVEIMANKLVEQTLTSVVAKLKEQNISNPGQDHSPPPQDLASSWMCYFFNLYFIECKVKWYTSLLC